MAFDSKVHSNSTEDRSHLKKKNKQLNLFVFVTSNSVVVSVRIKVYVITKFYFQYKVASILIRISEVKKKSSEARIVYFKSKNKLFGFLYFFNYNNNIFLTSFDLKMRILFQHQTEETLKSFNKLPQICH